MKNTKFKLSKIELVIVQRFFDNIKSLINLIKKTNFFLKYRNKLTISTLVFFFSVFDLFIAAWFAKQKGS